MDIPEWSRRHALQAIGAAATVGVAGCNAVGPQAAGSVPALITDYARLKVRTQSHGWLVTDAPGRDGSGTATGPQGERTWLLRSDADVGAVRFYDPPNGRSLQSFVERTGFDSESVALIQQPIGTCYRVRLTGVTRPNRGEVRATLSRELRPAFVDCAVETSDVVALAIRLPFRAPEGTDLSVREASGASWMPAGGGAARPGGESDG